MRALLLCFFLLPAAALGQTWTINYKDGVAVMDRISVINFTIANTGSTQRLNSISLQFPNKGKSNDDYDIEGGIAPAGWVVSAVDKLSKVLTFTAIGGCPNGLAPGASAVFGVKLLSNPTTADVTQDAITFSKTTGRNTCTNVSFTAPTGTGTWKRVGLAASMSVSPRTLDAGDSLAVQLTINNRSSATQSNITGAQPVAIPGSSATFGYLSGPTPASLTLAPGATGTLTWTFIANTRGLAMFTSAASNGAVTSEVSQTMQVNVGMFPGMVSLNPYEPGFGSQVTSGGQVMVHLTVSNNSADLMANVSPNPPSPSGSATAALVSGPTPASVATLTPGNSARFTWVYQVSGIPGDTYQFTAQGVAQQNGLWIATDPVNSATGYVVTHTVRPEPRALASGATARTISYTVANGGTSNINKVGLLAPDVGHFIVSGTPFAADTSGWPGLYVSSSKTYEWTAPNTAAEIPPGGSKTFTLSYSSIGTVSTNSTFTHRFILTQIGGSTVRVEGGVTIFISRIIPEVNTIGVVSTNGKNTIIWNNPSDHDGVLVLRAAGAPPNALPVLGTRYPKGATLGNATVVYSDSQSFTSSVEDSGLTNGTSYYYRVYNHDEFFIYSAGNVPTTNGVLAVPTAGSLPNPAWCYSFGLPSLMQPVAQAGVAVYSASNAGTLTANITAPSTLSDGSERWRPVALKGAVQGRFLLTDLLGKTGKHLVVGDQAGYAYAVNTATGLVAWAGFGGVALGNALQAQPVIQLNFSSNASFQSTHPGRDLVFFATRNSSTTNNRVYALSSVNGGAVWTYSPGDLDVANGGMLVEYAANRLWLATSGTSNSVRVIDTLTGNEVTRFNVGPSDFAVNADPVTKYIYITTNAGAVTAIDPVSLTVKWTYAPGAMSSYAFPIGNGFIATLKSGVVQGYKVDPTTFAVTPMWATPPSIPNPSGVRIDYTMPQKLYVGGGDGKVHQIDVATGVDEKQVTLSSQAVGTPTLDLTAKRLFVGTIDGRICAIQFPF